MTVKILGSILVILGCGGFGLSIAAGYRFEEATLRHLLAALDFMQSELQYKMTPLPELCRQAAAGRKHIIADFLNALATELESQISPDADGCLNCAISKIPPLPNRTEKAIMMLGASLGRFDMEGQIRGMESVRSFCKSELETLALNRENRLRSYQTLSLCMGAALAILFV